MIGKYLLFNQNIVGFDCYKVKTDCELVVYEVLRVIDSIPLFYHDHFDRLITSCIKVDKEIKVNCDLLYERINELIQKNGISVGNLMIKVFFYSDFYDISVFFIPHSYPSFNDYKNGVEVGFLNAERDTPEAKVEQALIRERANKTISNKGYYEVLLVNKYNELTEGSRTNLFLIKNNIIITSPLNKVLKGITLSKVLEIAAEMKINIEFQSIKKNELNTIDAMFITGTSPQILPVKKAGSFNFTVNHPLLHSIMLMYEQLITNNISQKKGL